MADKNFIVVGGSSGIGLSLVQRLSKAGHQVMVISRTSDTLSGLANVTHLRKDVLTDSLAENELPDILHGLAYCPGSIHLKPFRSLNPNAFLEDFNINVVGAVKVLQSVQKALKKAESPASVVLFSTVAVGQGMPFHTSVASAKGAVEGLTRSLAAEWVPNVRVNCIAPSLTDTPLAERLLSTPEKKEASAQRHPLKRVGKPDDIASLAHFLLSENGSWITGQVIGMDGGMSTVRV